MHPDNSNNYEFEARIKITVSDNKYDYTILKDNKNDKIINSLNKGICIYEDIKELYKTSLALSDNDKLEELMNNLTIKLNKTKNDELDNLKEEYENIINEKDILINKESNKYDILNNKLSIIKESNNDYLESTKKLYEKNMCELYEEKLKNAEERIKNAELMATERGLRNEEKLKESNTITTIINLLSNTAKTKGRQGEDLVYDTLIKSFGKFIKIDKVNGTKHSGDIYIEYGGVKTMIEVKNHEGIISIGTLEKFKTKDIYNENYNSGVFISLKSKFSEKSKIEHYDIEFIDGKPVIFLCNPESNLEDIVSSIIVLNNLIRINKENKISDIQTYITKFKNDFGSYSIMKKNNMSMMNILKENTELCNKKQDEIKLFQVIDDKPVSEYKCLNIGCDKIYKSKNGHYYNHVDKCKFKNT